MGLAVNRETFPYWVALVLTLLSPLLMSLFRLPGRHRRPSARIALGMLLLPVVLFWAVSVRPDWPVAS